MRVLRALLGSAPTRRTDRDWEVQLTSEHRSHLRCVIDDLVHRHECKVHRHELGNRAQAGHGGADCEPDDSRLGDRRVTHPSATEFGHRPLRDTEGSPEEADVLSIRKTSSSRRISSASASFKAS